VLFNSVDYVHNSGHFSLASDAQTLVTEISELLYCEAIDQSRIDYFMTVLNEMDPFYWNSAWNSYLQSGVDVQVKIRLDALFTKMINAPEFQLM